MRCFKRGEFGHRISELKSTTINCFKCGKPGHRSAKCKSNTLNFYNCGQHGHISTQCEKPKKAQPGGKAFALSGSEPISSDRLIRGTCFINGISLIAIIDMGVTHLFISIASVKRLNLDVYDMNGNMVIDTLTKVQ